MGPFPDDAAPRARRAMGLTSDGILAIAALVVSLTAVAVSFYQARLMRTQQSASVWPYVEVSMRVDSTEPSFRIDLTNAGIGPALVRSVEIRVDGKARRNWDDVLNALLGRTARHASETLTSRVIPAGRAVEALAVRASEADAARQLPDLFRRVEMSVCYCSVFDNCWVVHDTPTATSTESRSACPVHELEFGAGP